MHPLFFSLATATELQIVMLPHAQFWPWITLVAPINLSWHSITKPWNAKRLVEMAMCDPKDRGPCGCRRHRRHSCRQFHYPPSLKRRTELRFDVSSTERAQTGSQCCFRMYRLEQWLTLSLRTAQMQSHARDWFENIVQAHHNFWTLYISSDMGDIDLDSFWKHMSWKLGSLSNPFFSSI